MGYISRSAKKDIDYEVEIGGGRGGREYWSNLCLLLKRALHILSCTVLSLLLPLSFLLLARVSSSSIAAPSRFNTLFAFLYVDLPLFHAIVSLVCFAAVVYVLTGHLYRPPNATAWALLCLMQASVAFGVEATLAAGFQPTASTGVFVIHNVGHALWVKQAVIYVGVYTTMRFWRKIVVKPVVNGTLLEAVEGQRRGAVDKLVLSVAFAALWVAMVQHEVAPMVFLAINKRLRIGMAWDANVRWLIAHTTVVTGIARIIQGLIWLVRLIWLRLFKVEEDEEEESQTTRNPCTYDQV